MTQPPRQEPDEEQRHRQRQLVELARGFSAQLSAQTGVELLAFDRAPVAGLTAALERLDLALAQLADLASVYGDDSRAMLDPLNVPAAAVVGEYLRAARAGAWRAPNPGDTDSLVIVLPGGTTLDLLAIARRAFADGAPCFAALGVVLDAEASRREPS